MHEWVVSVIFWRAKEATGLRRHNYPSSYKLVTLKKDNPKNLFGTQRSHRIRSC